ncbi:acyltransferase [Rosistilla oblonga]|uniref:acyltransferase n=1 Tax=Rosistilla oblonga TaxID=2527990 RepID=UPI003A96B355
MLHKFEIQKYVCNRIMASIPSHHLRLLFYRYAMRFKIGHSSFIFMNAWFDTPGKFTMGHNSVINQKCKLDNRGGLTIGNNVSISSEVCILTADHDPSSPQFAGRYAAVTIEDHSFVGTRAMIMPGVTVRRGGVVAAGSVVTKDVPEFTVVAGVPAKPIKDRCREVDYRINYGLWFY